MFVIIYVTISFGYLYMSPLLNTKFATSKTDQFMILGEQVVLMII